MTIATNDLLTDTPIANVIRFYKGKFSPFSIFSMFSEPPFWTGNSPFCIVAPFHVRQAGQKGFIS